MITDEINGRPIEFNQDLHRWEYSDTHEIFAGYTLIDFGKAIQALKEGKRITRETWNGKRSFVFKQIPSTIGIEIVPKMQSLPETVKKEFISRTTDIHYVDQLCIVDRDNSIHTWNASAQDIFADDWCILD